MPGRVRRIDGSEWRGTTILLRTEDGSAAHASVRLPDPAPARILIGHVMWLVAATAS